MLDGVGVRDAVPELAHPLGEDGREVGAEPCDVPLDAAVLREDRVTFVIDSDVHGSSVTVEQSADRLEHLAAALADEVRLSIIVAEHVG